VVSHNGAHANVTTRLEITGQDPQETDYGEDTKEYGGKKAEFSARRHAGPSTLIDCFRMVRVGGSVLELDVLGRRSCNHDHASFVEAIERRLAVPQRLVLRHQGTFCALDRLSWSFKILIRRRHFRYEDF
jgi:hypothetical protein